MSQLLDLLRVATPPSPTTPPTVTLRDVLHLTAVGYSLATAAMAEPFSVVDEQVYKVRHPHHNRGTPKHTRECCCVFPANFLLCVQTLLLSLRPEESHVPLHCRCTAAFRSTQRPFR
jgi:hypothetical protein